MIMTYEEKLIELALNDQDIIVITAENRSAIRKLPDIIPQQFVDTGIAEQTMIGVAVGLALRGRKPVVHALATFLTMRAFEFIRTDIGISGLPVKLVGAVPGFLSEANGPAHQALEDISIMRSIPGMRIFCPADEEDLVNALPELFADPHPCYIRFNNLKSSTKHTPFHIGKGEIIVKQQEINILTYGFLLREALGATAKLDSEGINTGVINLRMLYPVDEQLILDTAEKSRLLVILEDHFITGGLYSIVTEILVRNKVSADILPINLTTWFKPALIEDVLEYEGFKGTQIAEKIISHINKNEFVRELK